MLKHSLKSGLLQNSLSNAVKEGEFVTLTVHVLEKL